MEEAAFRNSGSRISNLIMSCLHLGVRGPPVGDVLRLEQTEGLDRYLANLAGEAADARPGRQLVEATHPIFLGQEPNEDSLHDQTSHVL